MCFKKFYDWLTNPDPEPIIDPIKLDHKILHFAINDYPGTANDLNGCINDGMDMIDRLNLLYPNQEAHKSSIRIAMRLPESSMGSPPRLYIPQRPLP